VAFLCPSLNARAIAFLNVASRQEIEKLLQQFDYDQALLVYLPHASSALKQLLQKGCNSFTTKKLKQGLRSLMEADKLPDVSAPRVLLSAKTLVEPQQAARAEAYHQYPLEVQAKVSEAIHLFKTAELLKRDLSKMNALERRDAVLQIVELFSKNQQLRDEVNHFEKTGQLPPEVKEKELIIADDITSMHKRYLTLRTYKRRASWPTHEPEFKLLESKLRADGII
jgi:hypothetical protein